MRKEDPRSLWESPKKRIKTKKKINEAQSVVSQSLEAGTAEIGKDFIEKNRGRGIRLGRHHAI